MDEYDPNETPKTETQDFTNAAADAARDAAKDLKDDAQKSISEIRGRGLKGFFDFKYMYFPVIARYVFVVIVVLTCIGMVMGILGGLLAMVSTGILGGLGAIIGSVVAGVLTILFTRITFEMMLLGFKIYEGVQEINRKTRG